MTRTKRILAAALAAGAIGVGTAVPALASDYEIVPAPSPGGNDSGVERAPAPRIDYRPAPPPRR